MLMMDSVVLKRTIAAILILRSLGCALAQPAPATMPDIPTVTGPESQELVRQVRGRILMTEPLGGITMLELPELRESPLRARTPSDAQQIWCAHALAGPEDSGRVALVDGNMMSKRHRLAVMQLGSGKSRILFERRGDPLWDHVISSHIALTSAGPKVAIITPLGRRQMPGALHYEGPIEVWDIDLGNSQRFDVRALDERLAWLPDGRRIVFARLVPREKLPMPELDGFLSFYRDWPMIPAIHLLDTTTGKVSLIHPGRSPIVSPDGKQMLVMGESDQVEPDARNRRWAALWRLVACDGTSSKPVELHGDGFPLALLNDGIYLTLAQPTAGRPPRLTENNSPPGGTQADVVAKARETGL